jgi:hypothetical protein
MARRREVKRLQTQLPYAYTVDGSSRTICRGALVTVRDGKLQPVDRAHLTHQVVSIYRTTDGIELLLLDLMTDEIVRKKCNI